MKSIVESVLVKHLGRYVQGLKNSLDIGLLDGQVSIQNVSLRSSFFNDMGLPLTLKFSHIEKIHIDIPWTSLKDKSTVVTVSGIYALWSMNFQQVQQQVNPMQLLKSMTERIKLQMKKKWLDGAKDEGFAQKNLIRIVDNAIVSINNIHLRIECFKRGWDYSLGVIMDKIDCYTVDQDQQKHFYRRSFSKKQKNLPFHKLLNIETFKVYHNDEEEVFICNHIEEGKGYLLKMMAYPFAGKQTQGSKKNTPKKKSIEDLRSVPHYEIKTLAVVGLGAMGTQTFAEDMRYNVSLKIQVNKIDFFVGDKQLSQLIFTFQHFYEYLLYIRKNGGKTFSFEENAKRTYRALLTKIARDQKLNQNQRKVILSIISEVPVSILETLNDQIINEVRVENEVKKISKISNVEKSKKMMQELIGKKDQLDAMEGVQLFKEVKILSQIDRVVLGLVRQDQVFAQFGLLGVMLDCIMDLNGVVKVSCKFISSVFRSGGKQFTQDLYDLSLPWLHLYVELHKQELTKVHVALQKKEITFNEEVLTNLIDWISLIRVSPSLFIFIGEQMNYSIDTTRLGIQFMCKKDRELHWSLSLPVVSLQIDSKTDVRLNFGHFFGQNAENKDQFYFQFMEGLQIICNNHKLCELGEGAVVTFRDVEEGKFFQRISVKVPSLMVQNIEEVIQLIYAVRKSHTFSVFIKYSALNLVDQSGNQELEGEFYLNKIKTCLRMRLVKNSLVFSAVDGGDFPEQEISLSRTRLYKLISGSRYFIVFKEQVDKMVNIVEATSFKAMETIFLKLKDYIHTLATSYQWEKYHVKTYEQDITTLEQIQDIDSDNKVEMVLKVGVEAMSFQFSKGGFLNFQRTNSTITYNQFNTEAEVSLNKVDLIVDKEKIIYDASFRGKYSYLQSMLIQLQVLHLGYEVKLHQTISTLIAIGNQYEILIYELRSKSPRQRVSIQEDEGRLKGIKSQNNRTDHLNKFLLQRKFTLETSDIVGKVLGYNNRIAYWRLEVEKYRNEQHHRILTELKGVVLMSMIELPLVNFKYSRDQIELLIDSINAEINLQVILFQLIRGEGSLILKQAIRAYRDRQISRKQQEKALKMQQQSHLFEGYLRQNFLVKVDYLMIEVGISGSLCVGLLSRDLQFEKGRFSWNGLLFELNRKNISTTYNNGILKWCEDSVDLIMTNCKIKLNSKEVIFLLNEVHKMVEYLKSKNYDFVEIIREEMNRPDEKGRVMEQTAKVVSVRIEDMQLIYECADKNPLLSLRMKPISLTNEGRINSINLSIWHLNRSLKLYEPIIQPFQLKVVQKGNDCQLDFFFDNLYIVVTQECVIDVIEELRVLREFKDELEKDETNELEQMNREELERIKRNLTPQHFKEYVDLNDDQVLQYSFVLKITNSLGSKAIVQASVGHKQRQQILYQGEGVNKGETKSIKIAQKTSYSFSYQLIQRYQKINIKICLINSFYSARTVAVQFLLYDRDNSHITPVKVVDANGDEKQTNMAVVVQYSEGVYRIDIRGMYSIRNQTQLPLFFRYSDHISINKLVLGKGDEVRMPLWVTDSVHFGIQEQELYHLLRLRPLDGVDEPGDYELRVRREFNCSVLLLIRKDRVGGTSSDTEKQMCDNNLACVYTYRVLPAVLVKNHLQFPITINGRSFQFEVEGQLSTVYEQGDRQYIKLSLGDRSTHQIYLGGVDETVNVNLKLSEQNYVVLYTLIRRNKLNQRILHIYAQLQLILNIPHMFVPQLRTNIYNYFFILKKEVKNGYSDKVHPSPILKDKFVFNTFHYLLSLEEKYIRAELNGCKSNQIILYHSDFDKDLKFRQNEEGQPIYVFAVSYATKYVELQSQVDDRVADVIQCNYAFIMPKYYLINKAESIIVVDGGLMVRNGEKIALDRLKGLSLTIRDQMEYHYVPKHFNQTTHLMFVRGEEVTEQQVAEEILMEQWQRKQTADMYARYHAKANRLDQIAETSEVHSGERKDDQEYQEIMSERQRSQKAYSEASPLMKKTMTSPPVLECNLQAEVAEVQAERVEIQFLQEQPIKGQGTIEKQDGNEGGQGEQDALSGSRYCVRMCDVLIFALSKRVCDYNTISYQVSEWREWLTVKNMLSCPILLRVKLNEDTLGIESVRPFQTGRIISGLSERMEIALFVNGEELVLGTYDLRERLNHTIFLNDFQEEQVVLKEYKVKLGRQMVIEGNRNSKDKTIYKVLKSINFDVCKVTVSLVVHDQKVRRELVRFNVMHPKLMLLHYKNGLYMGQLKIDLIHGIFKRMLFLVIKDLQGYLQGFQGEFIERVAVSSGDTMHLTVTDDMIASVLGQVDTFKQYIPKSQLYDKQEVILQQQQTYHINSLGIKGIQIKLCLRKVLSDMNEYQSKVFEQMGLSMIEVQDAVITLSEVDISVPLKTKHFNGISQMYAMEAFVGIASGLNILGNPAQFLSQFEAGRNRGGVLPFCRSIVAGVSNSLSKIIGTIGSGFSQLTFDKEFMRSRIRDKNKKAQGFGQGLRMGLLQFGYSVVSGITGLVQQPALGFREQGGVGVLKGTLFGITGLVTKPVTGLILAISKTIEGINSTITYLDYHNLLGRDLIIRPLYHKFKMVRPYRSEDELAYNILLNWYEYEEVQLVGSYLLESEEDDSVTQLLIVTCSELILIDLSAKEIVVRLTMERLMATGKFLQGVVLYFKGDKSEDSQDQLVFRMTKDNLSKENLYWTLKSFIGLQMGL